MSNNTFIGNLTQDPTLRYTQSNKAVVNVGLAVNHRYQVNGDWQEETSFLDLTIWGELAENVATSLTKGTRVIVDGRLRVRPWTQGEKKGINVEVIVNSIGPDLRWATAEVKKNARPSEESRG